MVDFAVTPRVNYPFIHSDIENGVISISGISIPEYPRRFYIPLLQWVDEYFDKRETLTVNFKMLYFGNISSKVFYDFFQVLHKHQLNGKQVVVNWYHLPEDTDIRENGKEFSMLFQFPFHFQEHPILTKFSLPKTESSPSVCYDEVGNLKIEGMATSHKPWEYFQPITLWLNAIRFSSLDLNIKAEIHLNQINRFNLRFLNTLIKELELIENTEQKKIKLIWGYTNDEMKAIGESILLQTNISSKLKRL